MIYHSKYQELCQEEPALLTPLSDIGRTGQERPWRRYKVQNEYLAAAYDSVDEKKADRLRSCARVLTFEVDGSGTKRLVGSDHCRVRLCPLCSWRRSLKNYYSSARVVDWLRDHERDPKVGKYSYIFVTCTVKNVTGERLSAEIDRLFYAWKKLWQRKEVRAAWKGMVRNLEVTHNVNPKSKDFDTFHPHFHALVAVRPSYFTDSAVYISQKKLCALWRDALGADYDPVVDIRRVKGSDAGAIAECSKYATKASEIIIPDDWNLTVETVRLLDKALANRRLINYSGIFREVKQLLKLEDCEDGNLTFVGESQPELQGAVHRIYYMWYSGYRQYYLVE